MERIPEDAGGPTQSLQCTRKFSKVYVVLVKHPAPLTLCRVCNRLRYFGLLFFIFWALFASVSALHFAVWYPRFDLKGVLIRNFNVTIERALNYDMDIVIEARHFSSIRRIEDHSYEIRIAHNGTVFGVNHVSRFHPNNRTMRISSTQHVDRLPLGDHLGDLVSADLNAMGRLALRVYLVGTMTTALFLTKQKKKRDLTCDLILMFDRLRVFAINPSVEAVGPGLAMVVITPCHICRNHSIPDDLCHTGCILFRRFCEKCIEFLYFTAS